MDQFAIVAILVARPGKESEVEAFLKSAQPLAAAGARHHYLVCPEARPFKVRYLRYLCG